MNKKFKKFGENLKRIRIEKGLSQANLARELKVDKSYISNIENGKQNLTLATIFKLAKILEESVTSIVEDGKAGTIISSHTNSFSFGEDKFFLKILDKKNFIRENNGYMILSKHYPVSRLIYASPYVKRKGVLIFKYENTISKNKGLLVDQFAYEDELSKELINILNLYKKIFLKTLQKDHGKASDIFFKDRLRNRIPKYYSLQFTRKNFNFSLNGNKISVSPNPIFKNVSRFFKNEDKKWCVVSQCDPNDLNIGIKPIIFDYTAGGLVPLMAEFATFFWYQLAQGSYLSLKYNKKAFIDHKEIYKKMDHVSVRGNKIKHIPSEMRLAFIEEYVKCIINPCFKKIPPGDIDDWYEQFKNYLAMKIIGVFNVSKMSRKDQLLSMGYLQFFYNKNITHPDELLALIKYKN